MAQHTQTSQMDAVMRVVTALTDKGCHPKRVGKGFRSSCPAHDDPGPSLQIDYGDKGALVYCQAGCRTPDVLAAVGMKSADMFDTAMPSGNGKATRSSDMEYIYEDENGKVLYRVERKAGKRFVQSKPDGEGGWVYTLGNCRRVPYRLRKILRAVRDGVPIFVVEGEKDVHLLEGKGLVATTNAGGAGKWRPELSQHFKGATIVQLPDNDEPGRTHMMQVAESLRDLARSIRCIGLPGIPEKGDVSDWFQNEEHTVDKLQALVQMTEPLGGIGVVTFKARELMKEEFPEVTMAVPGVIALGVTLLVGAPKIGKSWMSLGLALSVSGGTNALGTIPVQEGPVLYLALEDTPRRLQNRMNMLMGMGQEPPENLTFATSWPRMSHGGLEHIENWLIDHPEARMVIIDTWAKVRPFGVEESMYQADYSAISNVKRIADKYGTPIVLVHHQRKAGDGDPLNTISGSTGLSGAADAAVILTRPRGAEDGHMYVTGRDVEESRSILSFDGSTGQWLWLGEADDVEEGRSEDAITSLLRSSPEPMGPRAVAEALEMKEGTAKWLMAKMCQEDKIKRVSRGRYIVEDGLPTNQPSGTPGQRTATAIDNGAQPAQMTMDEQDEDGEWGEPE